ncbi:MAG: hypothetical protein HC895_01375 [Leptolyngbyaceae cyanobacterium SM1_3_5]|nr:hypothetical protein [Leptolyngbyaceae cyanobacterium SM1_3_5]
MAKSLSNASKSASRSVSRLTGGKSNSTPTRSTSSSSITPANASNNAVSVNPDRRVAVVVPGLYAMNEASIPQMMPQFDPAPYQVTDPLNPPETIPQLTVAEFERNKNIYEGGIRALQSTGLAMDLSRERFTVIGKQAKAIGAGFNALNEQEKAKGSLLDFYTQQELTQQKGLRYQLSTHQTQTETEAFPHAIVQLDEALEQQRIKAELATAKREEAANSLTTFQESLGKFLPAKRSA